jgi:CheY-like chemotaxis protein
VVALERDDAEERRVRSVVVDDDEDVRFLLRMMLSRDPHFEVVGEAANGREAIDISEATQPDLLVLDRQMPVMGGVEAIPEIRRRSPRTAIVLYTAANDGSSAQAAMAAGATYVLEKTKAMRSLVDELSRILLERWSEPDTIEVRVGPVPSAAARVWIENTATILAAVIAHPEAVDHRVSPDALARFEGFLNSWRDIALRTDEFQWVARADATDVQRLIENWVTIDSIGDEQLAALGCHWSPPEGQPFFQALTSGVLEALALNIETQELARTLSRRWGTPA